MEITQVIMGKLIIWELGIGPQASGDRARIVEYEHRLEFDRNYHLAVPSGTVAQAAQQQEFEALQLRRQRK